MSKKRREERAEFRILRIHATELLKSPAVPNVRTRNINVGRRHQSNRQRREVFFPEHLQIVDGGNSTGPLALRPRDTQRHTCGIDRLNNKSQLELDNGQRADAVGTGQKRKLTAGAISHDGALPPISRITMDVTYKIMGAQKTLFMSRPSEQSEDFDPYFSDGDLLAFASVGMGFKENRTSGINDDDKALDLFLANQPPESLRPETFRSNQHGYGLKKGSATAAPRHQGTSAQDFRVMGIESPPLLEQHLLTSYNAKKVYMSPPAMTVITEPVLQDWANDARMDKLWHRSAATAPSEVEDPRNGE